MSIFLLLGSNQGDRLATLLEAGRMINERIGQMVRSSSIYTTQAWGQTEQADFLNQVIEIESGLRAEEILHQALEIEKHLGRQRIEKGGPGSSISIFCTSAMKLSKQITWLCLIRKFPSGDLHLLH